MTGKSAIGGPARFHDPRQSDRMAWAHGGLAVGPAGELVTFDQGTRELVIVHRPGLATSSTDRWPTPAGTAHAITREDGDRGSGYWLVDPGISSRVEDGRVVTHRQPAWVGRIEMRGDVGLRLARPRRRAFRDAEFRPTALAVTTGRHGPEYWLADGYGSGHILRYDAVGAYLGLVDATRLEPAGFRIPHAIAPWTDGRVLIADREHGRIVVVDEAGVVVRSLGQGRLSRPAGVVGHGADIVVAELNGRISVLDGAGRVARLAGSPLPRRGRYWPNAGRAGRVRAPAPDSSAVLRSPHGLAIDKTGTVWTSEWVIGGRLTSIRLPGSD
jgi:hypothetical protein